MSKVLFVSNEDVAVLTAYLVREDTAPVLALVPSLVSALEGPIVSPPPVWNLQEAVSAARSNTNYPEDYDELDAWLDTAKVGEWTQDKMLVISDADAATLQRWTGKPETALLYVNMPSLRDALVRPFIEAPPLCDLQQAVSAARSNTNFPEDYEDADTWLDEARDSARAREKRESPAEPEADDSEERDVPEPEPAAEVEAPEPACVCGGRRFAYVNSMARDCNYLSVPHLKLSHDGYLPRICPGFDGDGFRGAICLDCGRVQGKFPVSDASVEEALNES